MNFKSIHWNHLQAFPISWEYPLTANYLHFLKYILCLLFWLQDSLLYYIYICKGEYVKFTLYFVK
jgi:hypothetical protein